MENANIAIPSKTRTTPVARLRVAGVALFANLAATLAHIRVNTTQRARIVKSGIPPMAK